MGDYTDMTGEPAKPSGAVFKWGRGGASRVEEYADLSESQPTINASRMGSAPRPESKEAADPAAEEGAAPPSPAPAPPAAPRPSVPGLPNYDPRALHGASDDPDSKAKRWSVTSRLKGIATKAAVEVIASKVL